MSNVKLFEQLLISPSPKANQVRKRWFHSLPSFEASVSATLDAASAMLAGLLSFQLRFDVPLSRVAGTFDHATLARPAVSVGLLSVYAVYVVLLATRFDLYRPRTHFSIPRQTAMVLQAVATAGLLLSGTLFATRQYVISRIVVAATVALTFCIVGSRHALASYLQERRRLPGVDVRNVLVVGEGRVAHALRQHFLAKRQEGIRFKGFVTTDKAGNGTSSDGVIGNLKDCVSLARSLFVDEIYFSSPADSAAVTQVAEEARAYGIDVFVVPELFNGLAWNAPVDYVGQFPVMRLHRRPWTRNRFAVKRAFDVLIASLALLLFSPLMLVLTVLVRVDSDGPSLYRAKRVGRKGRVFRCYKFRTMVADADAALASLAHMNERNSILFKITNDPRITKLGAVLRKYSLDELPQLFNVIKGDMSLVGPRPPLVTEVDKYALSHLRRLDVLPGITGLWQVHARQDPSFDSYITLDTKYVENWSLGMDLRIMVRTASVIFGGTGA